MFQKNPLQKKEPFFAKLKLEHNRMKIIQKYNDKVKRQMIDSGRSMVEMLGVLAVIGVLSITGIAGYKVAINKYIANETLSELNLRATDYAFQMQRGAFQLINNFEDKTKTGFPIEARVSPQYLDYFEIFIREVPSAICRELVRMPWRTPYSIFVGTEEFEANEAICNQAPTVELAYEFFKEMTPKEEVSEDSRHEIARCYNDNDCKCGNCVEGLCQSYCTNNETCAKNYDQSSYLMCCPNENVANGICCTTRNEQGECCNSMGNCCSPDKPLRDSNGVCFACDEYGKVDVTDLHDNCSICPERFLSNNYCMFCNKDEFANRDGNCITCDETNYIYTTETECNKCSNRTFGFFGNNKCMLTCDMPGTFTDGKKIYDRDGMCFSCDYEKPISFVLHDTPSSCESVCPNRKLFEQYCILPPQCTSQAPLWNKKQECVACNTLEALPEQENCASACNNTRENKDGYCVLKACGPNQFKDNKGNCLTCTDAGNYVTETTATECAKCTNRSYGFQKEINCMLPCNTVDTYTDKKPLMSDDGICFACDYSYAVSVGLFGDKSRCEKACTNRKLINNKCVLQPTCSSDEPLLDKNYQCASCETTASLPEQSNCSSACNNMRENKNGFCVLKECEENSFRDNSENCVSCYDAGNYATIATKDECDKCSNRTFGFYGNKRCMLPCDITGTHTEGKPLFNHEGICYSCNYPEPINVGLFGDKNRCTTICPNRELDGNNCVRKTCSNAEALEDSEGNCHVCNITTPINVNGDREKCNRCLNRTLRGQYCVLNN